MRLAALPTLLFLLLLFPASSFGQQVNGNLEGRVLDDQGNPVAYVNISVAGPNIMGVRGTVSTPDGVFRVLALPVGEYTIDVQHVSFRKVTMEDVRIALGATTTVGPVRLAPQAIEMDAIVVRAEEHISFSSTEVGGRLSSEDLDFLPTERDHLTAAAYMPHVNTSYLRDGTNVAGSTGAENAYFIDGVNVTDPHLATGSMRLPQSFIRAIEVKAGGYQGEYGRSSGGIVNVVTHSGGLDAQGSAGDVAGEVLLTAGVVGEDGLGGVDAEARVVPGEEHLLGFAAQSLSLVQLPQDETAEELGQGGQVPPGDGLEGGWSVLGKMEGSLGDQSVDVGMEIRPVATEGLDGGDGTHAGVGIVDHLAKEGLHAAVSATRTGCR